MSKNITDEKIREVLFKLESPCGTLLGHRVTAIEFDPCSVRNEFTATREFVNGMGVVQGGILSAMLDTALTTAALVSTRLAGMLPTLEMKTSFINVAKPGKYIGDGRVLRSGRSIVFLEGSLYDEQENLVATGSATVKIIHKPMPMTG